MRKIVIILGLFLATTPARAETKPPKLIVHEWGTFTSFAGADGVYLDFRPLVGNDLPDFVFDLQRQTSLSQQIFSAYLTKRTFVTRSRMETPVTYFYTDEPLALQARVDFPHGLLTEFYPPVQHAAPAVESGGRIPPIGNALLDWGQITVFPSSQLEPARRRIPAVKSGNPYASARETDSDIVWFTDISGNYMEKFLFYRGVGNFDLPVRMQSTGRDRFTIANTGREPIHAAFLVQVSEGKVRFTRVGSIVKEAKVALSAETQPLEALADAMAKDLAADGLYEKEARAMVNTWKSSWFDEEGTRLLYLLPQSFTDTELPLKISPKPTQCLRVMVGRLETLTPEMENRIGQLLGQLGADDCAAREEAARQLRLLGRFAEPALQRVSRNTNDPDTRVHAATMLAAIRED